MSNDLPRSSLQLQSLVTPAGALELSLASVDIAAPAPDEVVVRIEAAPIDRKSVV